MMKSTIALALVDFAVRVANIILSGFRYKKYLPILKKVFDVVDPLIVARLPQMSQSELYELVKGTVIAVSDGELDSSEVLTVVNLFFANFSILKALGKKEQQSV